MARLRNTSEDSSVAIHHAFRKPKSGNEDIAKLKKKAIVDKQELSAVLHQKARKAYESYYLTPSQMRAEI